MDSVGYESADGARADWQALADASAADPFAQPGWFDAWRGAFGDRGFRLVCARRGNQLVGVLPVERARGGIVRSPTNLETPRFGATCADHEAAQALARFLVASGPRRLDMAFVPANDPLLQALAAVGAVPLTHHVAAQPYVDLSTDVDSYAATLPAKVRSELRRRRRRLDEHGEVTFEVHADTSLLDEGFAVEASGWKAAAGSAIASTPERTRFYTDLAHWAAGRDELRLAFLRVNGHPIAFSMFLRTRAHVWALKLGVDAAWRSAGAGQLLVWEALQHWLGRGLETFEFLGGADPFKLTWTSTTRDVLRVQLFGSSIGGALDAALWRGGYVDVLRRARSPR